jgi:hypothetical protein
MQYYGRLLDTVSVVYFLFLERRSLSLLLLLLPDAEEDEDPEEPLLLPLEPDELDPDEPELESESDLMRQRDNSSAMPNNDTAAVQRNKQRRI